MPAITELKAVINTSLVAVNSGFSTLFQTRSARVNVKNVIAAAVMVAAFSPTWATANTITTNFGTDNGNTVSDGGAAGFDSPFGIGPGLGGDTVNSTWTWYTVDATGGAQVSVPFGGSTASVGEQVIRSDELTPASFGFSWGATDAATALFGRYLTDAGTNSVQWVTSGNLSAYYRNNGGAWQTLNDSQSLSLAAGTFDILFVGNDGVDSNSELFSVAATGNNVRIVDTASVPEPSSIALLTFGLLGLARSRRKTSSSDLDG